MIERQFQYLMRGTAAQGQTWETQGLLRILQGQPLHELMQAALSDTFHKLTSGNAVFGQPGVGCNGPYEVIEFHLYGLKETPHATH